MGYVARTAKEFDELWSLPEDLLKLRLSDADTDSPSFPFASRTAAAALSSAFCVIRRAVFFSNAILIACCKERSAQLPSMGHAASKMPANTSHAFRI